MLPKVANALGPDNCRTKPLSVILVGKHRENQCKFVVCLAIKRPEKKRESSSFLFNTNQHRQWRRISMDIKRPLSNEQQCRQFCHLQEHTHTHTHSPTIVLVVSSRSIDGPVECTHDRPGLMSEWKGKERERENWAHYPQHGQQHCCPALLTSLWSLAGSILVFSLSLLLCVLSAGCHLRNGFHFICM